MELDELNKTDVKGTIFDIKRYAIHDGHGIRTTVFFKGCSLRCRWCHNPESLNMSSELFLRMARCVGCGQCIDICPTGAISLADDVIVTNADKCIQCCQCAEVCVPAAREIAGEIISVSDVLARVEKDIMFYETSGGGVTISGGEPLCQPDFLCGILAACKNRGISTAVDTTCYAPREVIARVSEYTDLFLCDIKHIDDKTHQRITGVSNELILENIKYLVDTGNEIIIRMPCIPGYNDSIENIDATGEFVALLKGEVIIEVLRYNEGGCEKSGRLIGAAVIEAADNSKPQDINAVAGRLKKFGLKVKVDGRV